VVLNWNSVFGAQGYRVYWWNGYQAVLLGTVGSSTTGVQISGLSPNTRSYFLIEAFSGSTVADSAWVSATTLAAAQPLNQSTAATDQHGSRKPKVGSWIAG